MQIIHNEYELNMTTAKRRSSSVRAWIQWIEGNL